MNENIPCTCGFTRNSGFSSIYLDRDYHAASCHFPVQEVAGSCGLAGCDGADSFLGDGGEPQYGKRENYFVNVSYEYSVMGTTHKGDRIALAYMGSQNPEMEHKLLEMLPVGRQVEVRYDPGDPQQSVLAHGIHSSTVFFLIFSIMLLSFLLSFLMMLWIRLRPDQVLLDSLRVHWDREASP